MPGVTPNRGYPFPVHTDPIDVPDDIYRLAMALDGDVAAVVSYEATRMQTLSGAGSSPPIDATDSVVFSTWLQLGSPVPPAWAHSMWIDITIRGIQGISSDCNYNMRTVCNVLGAITPFSGFVNRFCDYRAAGRFPVVPGVGNLIVLQASHLDGGGLRYHAGSATIGNVFYSPNVATTFDVADGIEREIT